MKPLVCLAWDVLISSLCNSALPLTSFVFTGMWLDAAEVAGLGLGISVCNITGVCIFTGMATAIDTLCSQAYGARRYRALGAMFARGTLLTACTTFPFVGALWYYMHDVLVAIGQDPIVAAGAGTFSRGYLWGMAAYVVFENLKKCLQAQSETAHAKYVSIVGVLANVLFHYITMGVLGMGIYGAGVALSMTGIFMLVALSLAVWRCKLGARNCWSDIVSWAVFREWPQYFKDCGPGLMGVFLEWASIEASILIAGLLGDVELSTQVALLSAYGILFNAGLSISIAATTRVGNLLGEGDAGGARQAARAAQKLAVGSAVVISSSLWLGCGYWPMIYGVTPGVMARIQAVAPLYAFVVILDQVQNASTGILKGMNMQHVQAKASIFAFWVMGVGLGSCLAYGLHQGVPGLWFALAVGECPLVAFYFYRIATVDWKELTAAARARTAADSDTELDSDAGDVENDSESTLTPPGPCGKVYRPEYVFSFCATAAAEEDEPAGGVPAGGSGGGKSINDSSGGGGDLVSDRRAAPKVPERLEGPAAASDGPVGSPDCESRTTNATKTIFAWAGGSADTVLPMPVIVGDGRGSTVMPPPAVVPVEGVVPPRVPVITRGKPGWVDVGRPVRCGGTNERSWLLAV